MGGGFAGDVGFEGAVVPLGVGFFEEGDLQRGLPG